MSSPGCKNVSYGSPGRPLACPAGAVLVGLELSVAPPGLLTPGAVQGVVAGRCAAADSVFARGGVPPARLPTGYVPPPSGQPASFVCPAGQALVGATAWVNPSGVAEQLQLQCAAFAEGGAPGASSPPFPASRVAGSAAAPVPLAVGGVPAAYAAAVGQGWGAAPDEVTALGFGCRDYADEFDDSDARRLACCGGAAENPLLCRGHAPQSDVCDGFVAAFCRADCSPNGGCAHAACGCLGSPVALPECFDSRCADTAGAYLTAAMTGRRATCPTSAPCAAWQALGDGLYLAQGVAPPAGCVPSPRRAPAALALVVLFFLVLLFAALGAAASPPKKAATFAPPPRELFA